jgi:hypothetical protein
VGDEAKGMWIGTFHSIFARVLRREADKIGFSRDFTIYDSDDSERLIKELMKRYNMDPKRVTPRSVKNAISGAKNAMVGPEEYARLAGDAYTDAVATLYTPYVAALRQANAMDFDDLLGWPIRLFEQHPDTLAEYQKRWKYLHIDEYQDTNKTQYVLAKLLAAQHHNLCVVGDDAQSIYAFRGADIQNILSFQKDYPGAKTVRLEQNYRSTQKIVRLADAVIKGNAGQLDKALWTDNDEGDPIILSVTRRRRSSAPSATSARGRAWAGATRQCSTAPTPSRAPSRRRCGAAASRTGSSAGRAFTSARRSRTRWPTSGWPSTPPMRRRSCACSTCPRAASAARPSSSFGRSPPSTGWRSGRPSRTRPAPASRRERRRPSRASGS